MSDRLLAEIARQQHSLVTRDQALGALTLHQVKERLRSGRLEPVRTGVYRFAGAEQTWEQHLLAACLAGGPGSAASFRSAAWLWRFDGFREPDQLEITVPRARRARLPGVDVHDTTVTGRAHTTKLDGIPITTAARTLCDLTSCCGLGTVARALDDALRRRITTIRRVEHVFLDLANQGRRRSTFMRALLEERIPGFDPGESPQEEKLVRWLKGAGLPRPTQQHPVRVGRRTYRLDLAYPDAMIAIEYDGWDAHRTRTSFDADRRRDIELEDADWRVLHFTAKSTRTFVVDTVRRALNKRTK